MTAASVPDLPCSLLSVVMPLVFAVPVHYQRHSALGPVPPSGEQNIVKSELITPELEWHGSCLSCTEGS